MRWVFFDMGSTLVVESKGCEHRIKEAIAGSPIAYAESISEERLAFSFYKQE